VGCDRLPETFHGKEGVDGSSPSEGSEKASKWPFLLPRVALEGQARPENLSPRAVPEFRGDASIWLERSAGRAQSTSIEGRCPHVSWSDVPLGDKSWWRSLAKPDLVGDEAPDRLVLVIPNPR
jgi:hypothetical protein